MIIKKGKDPVKALVGIGEITPYSEKRVEDEHCTAHHCHKKALSTKRFCTNVEGDDLSYSFHWKGISEKPYIFEASID